MPDRPHLVIINPDQWRGDVLGHLGNPAAVTPTLDRLVRTDAVSFRHAFCQNPVCTPSRCSFMTGWYPHVRGHRTMYHMLRPDEPMLLRDLKQAGYFVWWGGKNDVVPGQNGFEAYCDVKYRPAHPVRPGTHTDQSWRGPAGGDDYYSFYGGVLGQRQPPYREQDVHPFDLRPEDVYCDGDWANVLGAIAQIRHAPKDRPLCLYLPLSYPHPPYAVEQPYAGLIDPARLPPRVPAPADWTGKPSLLRGLHDLQGLAGWSEDRWTRLRAIYYAMCARVDGQIGLLVRALQDAGLYDDTALFVFSDHGDFTGDYGLVEKTQNTFEDCLTRVPLVIKPPAGVSVRPRVSDALVELIDFTATVHDFAGLRPAYTQFGRSLRGVLAGATDVHRDAVFCEGGRLRGEEHCMERQSASYNAPAGLYWPRLTLQQRETGEHSKAVMCRTGRYKYVRRLYEPDELYDLQADPGEQHNRVADPALAGVAAQLRERLLQFFLETADVVPFEPDRR